MTHVAGLDLLPSMPLVRVSGAVVALQPPSPSLGFLVTDAGVAVVNESALHGVPLILLAPPGMTLQQLLPPAEEGQGVRHAHNSPATAREGEGLAAKGGGQGQQGSPGEQGLEHALSVGLTDRGWQWLTAAWERRLQLPPMGLAGVGTEGQMVFRELLEALGIKDNELHSLGQVGHRALLTASMWRESQNSW